MEVLSLVNYYARLGYYRHVQTVCAEVLKKRANDPLVSLWKAFGMIKEGAAGEAVRELEAMLRRADPQMQLPLKIALMHAHRACKVVDTETLTRLETELMGSTEDTSVPDRARMTAAQLLWHFGETFDAKQHVQHILRMQKSNVPALVLSGWLELADAEKELSGVKFSSEACNGDPSEEFEAAESFFEQAIQAGGGAKDLDAMMGIAKLASMQGNHRGALDKLSEVIGLYAWFLPALAEKALVLLNLGDWEQAVETAQRVLAQSDNQGGRGAGAGTLDALRVCALHAISQETDARAAASRLTELSQALDRHEPLNARLYIDVARPFARLAGRNPALLSLTLALTNTACRIAPDKAEYAAENAYQLMLLEDHQGAMQVLKRASSLEEGADEVMPFLIKSQILAGEILDAEMQLEFVKELQAAPAPEMSFNMALVASRRYKDVDTAVGHLDRASTQQLAKARKLPLGSAFYASLNPDFLLEIAREYLKHCGEADGSALDEGSRAAQLLGKATRVLHEVAKHSPGLLDSQMQLARAHYLRADYEAALRCCSSIAKADPTFADAALLHAQILLKLDKTRQAGAVLDSALSHNFAVREQPLFQLIKAQILHLQGEFAEAETMLSRAIAAQGGAGARAGAQNHKSAGGRQRGAAMPPPPTTLPEELKLNLSDKCSLHMQLVDALLAQQKVSEAQSAMAAAVVEFDGTPVEGRLQIANAKVQVVKGDIESALQLLRAIPSESAHYHAARKALADLYLEHRNDKRAYAACHEEVAAANPTVASYMMLGEAYMAVLEPEKAIAAFETALRKSPNDPVLASRIGHVLVSTHAYAKAIEYYSDAAAADPSKTPLRYELAALYLNLKRYDAAMTELKQLIAACGYSAGAVPDGGGRARMVIEDALLVTKALQLQAKVHKALNALPEALEALHQAQSNQQNALAQLRAETGGADQLATQQAVAASVAMELGALHEQLHDTDAALDAYKTALKHNEDDEKVMLALARLHLARGEVDAAQQQCSSLMTLNAAPPADLDAARILIADIMIQKSEWDAAIYHFEQLLLKQPALFGAIAKMLSLLRRAGRMAEAIQVLKNAERSSPRAALEPGFRYCQGLLARYQNQPRAALRHLNMARRDGEYGEPALRQMIEIFLNPENETNWDNLNVDAPAEPNEAVKAAERLLREMPSSARREVLECYMLLATKERNQIDRAVAMLLELLGVEKDYLPALVCLSQAYLMLKQAPKARNHLKRVAKIAFQAELIDDFERGWLMLADVYIVGGKYDLAEELCWRCLASNKSCAKAWEFLGVVKEKEAAYKDAASHYEKAWGFENEASAAVGYKLSFNYLKAKKYVEAIDVCHKVLGQYPDYPRIKAEVLDPAREALRP